MEEPRGLWSGVEASAGTRLCAADKNRQEGGEGEERKRGRGELGDKFGGSKSTVSCHRRGKRGASEEAGTVVEELTTNDVDHRGCRPAAGGSKRGASLFGLPSTSRVAAALFLSLNLRSPAIELQRACNGQR